MRSVRNYDSFFVKFLLKTETAGDRAGGGGWPAPPAPPVDHSMGLFLRMRRGEAPRERKKKSFSCSWRSGERRRLLVLVPLHVESQMVGAGEAPAAGEALEGLGARVLPVVPGQLVGAGEAPVAAFPRALIGFLTCGEEAQVTAPATRQPDGDTATQTPTCPRRGARPPQEAPEGTGGAQGSWPP